MSMKEMPKILELLRAILEEKLGEPQNPLPGPSAQGENPLPTFEMLWLALQRYYPSLSLWAVGNYRRGIPPTIIQDLVNTFFLNFARAAIFVGAVSSPPSFESLRQQLQTFIDSKLD